MKEKKTHRDRTSTTSERDRGAQRVQELCF